MSDRDQITEGLASGQYLNHPWGLLPESGSHHSFLDMAACRGSAQQQDPWLQAAWTWGVLILSSEDPFGPQATSMFNCTSTYCWGGEQGAGLLQADSASRLPASPRAGSGCRQGGLQGSQNASAAQPPPTRGSTSTSVSHWHRVLPRFGGVRCSLQHLRHRVRKHCLSSTAAWGLTVWARIWSQSWPWGTPRARSRRQ